MTPCRNNLSPGLTFETFTRRQARHAARVSCLARVCQKVRQRQVSPRRTTRTLDSDQRLTVNEMHAQAQAVWLRALHNRTLREAFGGRGRPTPHMETAMRPDAPESAHLQLSGDVRSSPREPRGENWVYAASTHTGPESLVRVGGRQETGAKAVRHNAPCTVNKPLVAFYGFM